MCFSATASLIAGGSLSATGVLTIKKVKTKADLPFASIPLLFGIQQIIEGVVWLSFGQPLLNHIATNVYLLFAFVVWPIFVPFSVLAMENNQKRKKILHIFLFLGLAVGLYLLHLIIVGKFSAHVINKSIAYHSLYTHVFSTVVFYFLVTCGSTLFSSHRIVRMFGIIFLVSAAITTLFFLEAFISVWCFFAAILSILIFIYFYRRNKFELKQ